MDWPLLFDSNSFSWLLAEKVGVAYMLAWVSGLSLTLTPCVYPMIVVTVGIFTGGSKIHSKAARAALAAAFVLGMSVVLTGLGIGFALSGTVFGSLLSNKWVTAAFAILFFGLASGMFGLWDVAFPLRVQQWLSSIGGLGWRGAFLLGAVSAFVAAPCTGPFLAGLLIWISTTQNIGLGATLMFVFSLGLGFPFFLVGTFALSLPKGGLWMVGVKWVLGLVLATFAFHFLALAFPSFSIHARSMVDGSWSWLWVGVSLVMSGALFVEKVKKGIQQKDILAYAPLFVLSMGLFLLVLRAESPPQGIDWMESETEGIALAAKEDRPLLLDFRAEWCSVCKEFEQRTLADPRVRSEMSRFVPIRIDLTYEAHPSALKERYRVMSLPTLILVDRRGIVRARFHEFILSDELLAAMRAIP
ncbi:protein-disulfide reductase DsbD family protein [Pajaroellobacter abortibovis]|uniref:Thioredoxin domain-containing protein n=1 Tax=Pajaroellobacter abortibovis TaxID=1882918 RepID=A0A1L6MV13_9BACT|nr:cytochrome c biogenesis protein CcdA [Pajaroellobacter abortibovis]APR99353.1 hypothetical protein BCY86_00665 [Pajaroellobacter abortibovis]